MNIESFLAHDWIQLALSFWFKRIFTSRVESQLAQTENLSSQLYTEHR